LIRSLQLINHRVKEPDLWWCIECKICWLLQNGRATITWGIRNLSCFSADAIIGRIFQSPL